jgi:hypothetical protein
MGFEPLEPTMLKSLAFALVLATTAPAVVSAQDEATAQVTVRRDGETVVVHYQLPAPVQRFLFSDPDVVRDRWTVTTAGLTLSEGAVTGEQAFSAFDLIIRPDAAEVDRIYMGLSRIGEGVVLYGPGLRAGETQTSLTLAPAAGEASVPADALNGYVYLGAADQITSDAHGDVVSGADVDPALTDQLTSGFLNAMTFYGRRMDAALPYRPALLISVESPGPASFRGDVTDTGAISVRFQGDSWRGSEAQVTGFVWHEAFHLWNGHAVQTRDGESDPWLHEGGAEFAALVGPVATGAGGEDQARETLSHQINRCREILGDRDGLGMRLRSGSGPYACGTLIQWLADLELRAAGRGDVLGLWRTLLAAGRESPDGYGVSEFRALLVPDSAVAVLLDGPGQTRWATIKARLTTLNVTLENRPGEGDLQAAALFHVAGRNCKGSYGFFNRPGELKLDGEDCGVLSGQPIVDTVEGFDPQTDARAMFAAVRARCAEGLPVRYQARDGRVLEAVCDAPLAEPDVWAVVDAPPLAVGANSARPL